MGEGRRVQPRHCRGRAPVVLARPDLDRAAGRTTLATLSLTGVTDVVWLNFGSQAMTSCDPFVTAGEKRLMVLHPNGDGTYSVNPCVASGVIGTEAGDAALAEAQALFVAQPTPGPSPSDPPAAPQPLPDGADGGWLMVLGVLGVATLAFAAVVLIATRRRGAD